MTHGILLQRAAFIALILNITACKLPQQTSRSEFKGGNQNQPEACIGGEFALRGFNQAKPPQCLDVSNYPTLRYFTDLAEYTQIANRFRLSGALRSIHSKGVAEAQKEYALVANFKHDKKYWVAQIPTTEKGTRSVFQVSEFRIPVGNKVLNAVPPATLEKIETLAKQNPLIAKGLAELKSGNYTAAHGQLRIAFSEPILLSYEKDPTVQTQLNEIVLSVHAVSPGITPDTYDPIKGLGNEYGTATGVYSLEDKTYQAIARHVQNGKEPSLVRQYEITLSPRQIDQVLRTYFIRAKHAWETTPYNTLSRNCGSEIFEVLDEVLGFKSDSEKAISALGRQYPKYAQFAIHTRNLLTLKPGEKLDEFGGFRDEQIANPSPSLNKEKGFPEPQ
jgi:hypothetical protein